MTEPTALYRLFDADETLLYVGIARRPEQRWREHAIEKPWWNGVARKSIEWHESRISAAKAEAIAVRDERPTHNRALPAEDGSPRFSLIAPRPRATVGIHDRRFRTTDELWARFAGAVAASPDPEADMSKVLRTFVRWYVGEPGAKLPERPDPKDRRDD